MVRRSIALVLVLLPHGAAAAGATLASERARQVLKGARCGVCHDSKVSAENAKALAVYDLAEPQWAARMNDAQLPRLMGRLKSATERDQAVVRRFIAAELKARAGVTSE